MLIHINSSEWSISPGRFDQYLWPYYERDIAAGRLTRDQAAEWLACLWIKFNEVRVCAADIINYQNLMIGGVDQAGHDATNELSLLCIETTVAAERVDPAELVAALASGHAGTIAVAGCRVDSHRVRPAGAVQRHDLHPRLGTRRRAPGGCLELLHRGL